jgi:tRNA (cytidine/uridine-2'-O-)-methyltransferase
MSIEIALYQPDIAPNAGTIIRMAACFGLRVTIIEPAGFAWTDSALRRAGMDYLDRASVERAPSWDHFAAATAGRRVILLTTKSAQTHHAFQFQPDDILLMGRESSGVPQALHDGLPHRIKIPMKHGERSLNVSLACAIATAEALRQTGGFPAHG